MNAERPVRAVVRVQTWRGLYRQIRPCLNAGVCSHRGCVLRGVWPDKNHREPQNRRADALRGVILSLTSLGDVNAGRAIARASTTGWGNPFGTAS